jgi:hypothetical protein
MKGKRVMKPYPDVQDNKQKYTFKYEKPWYAMIPSMFN